MNISLNWLKDYIDIDLDPVKVGEILTDIGLEVEGEEEVESIKGRLEGIVIGYVKECGKHPNADKLSVTKVDVGGPETLDIVCGAPNVAAGQKVLVATIGTTLYSAEGEAWKIKKGKIRGEVSEGMICAEDELGLGTSHDGIMVLPEDAPVGGLAKDYFNIETDYVYEIGLTPNRSDATNHIGAARDLAAAMKVNYDYKGTLSMPDVDDFKVDSKDMSIDVVVENTEACPRFSGVAIRNIEIKPSPDWLKKRIEAVGVKSINNIVDITNFVLHELGQPLHAYDFNAISGKKIIVKTLPEGTIFKSLDEVDRKLRSEDLMICDGDGKGMCIGGVFGGIDSGVKEDTTSIFLEAAHFNAGFIRRSSMSHNLRTDAAKVFEKGSDPNITVFALKRAAMLIKELANGEIASDIIDIYPEPIEPMKIKSTYANINRMIGVDISPEKVAFILEAMDMEIVDKDDNGFTVAIPTNKADVTREADLIEEILRIYGFNNVPISGHISTAVITGSYPDPNDVRNKIADYLAANSFNEMMAVSLSESRYYKDIMTDYPEDQLVYINNTSNVHLDVMRPNMVFSGLEAVVRNQNRQNADLRLFEFGKTYIKSENAYKESEQLTLFMTGKHSLESWHNDGKAMTTYFTLKSYVENILKRLGVTSYQVSAISNDVFTYGLNYHRGPVPVVTFGKLAGSLVKQMDIKGEVFYAEFNWAPIFKACRKHNIIVESLNKYPSVRRDLALVVEKSVKFSDIAAIAVKTGKKLLRNINLFDVYESEKQLGANKKSYAVSFVFENPERTLKDKEIDKIMSQLIAGYESKLGAMIRK
jgi:phenylalanyl-tRNA synthetase beta chain